MTVSTYTEQTGVTVSNTEYSLAANSTTLAALTAAGAYSLVLDTSNMTSTEWYRVRVYEKAASTGTKRTIQTVDIIGPPADPLVTLPMLPLLNGWDFTLQKMKGTDRAFDWSIRKAA